MIISHQCSVYSAICIPLNLKLMQLGASIPPETLMHFPPVSDFLPIFETFSDSEEKFLDFHLPKFLMTFFLVIDHKFRMSPYFPCFSTFPPLFRENYYFLPTLTNFPPVLDKFTRFLHTLRVFRFPPTLTMMHLYITQCTYWTPLDTTANNLRDQNDRLPKTLIPVAHYSRPFTSL